MQSARLFLNETRGRGECVICPVGELTEVTAPALRTSITRCVVEGTRRIVLDLSLTSRIDAPGRDALVRCSRAVRAADATLVLTAAPDHVRDLVHAADVASEAQERLAVEVLIETDEIAVQRDRLEESLRWAVCGTFLHRTTTGHPLVCARRPGHEGGHQWR
jgi:anti-anti-sigma factor